MKTVKYCCVGRKGKMYVPILQKIKKMLLYGLLSIFISILTDRHCKKLLSLQRNSTNKMKNRLYLLIFSTSIAMTYHSKKYWPPKPHEKSKEMTCKYSFYKGKMIKLCKRHCIKNKTNNLRAFIRLTKHIIRWFPTATRINQRFEHHVEMRNTYERRGQRRPVVIFSNYEEA